MAMNNGLCLISAMDCLWHHQIILTPHMANLEETDPFTSSSSSSSTLPFSPLSSEEIPSSASSSSVSSDDRLVISQADCSYEDDKEIKVGKDENLTSFSVGRKLRKSMSCRSMGELEIEEIKGFMDLGFVFKKENLSPQMVNLLPGLQRLRIHRNNQKSEEEEEEEKMRPYLSEAWTIRRPNSALLDLKVPKFSSNSDMKKHLKFWAKIVASELQ